MPSFKPLDFQDKPVIDAALEQDACLLSDYNFTNLWMWNSLRNYQIGKINGFTLLQLTHTGKQTFLYPIGKGSKIPLIQSLMEAYPSFTMRAIPEEAVLELASLPLKFTEEEEHFDYIYSFDDLINLPGNRYQPKRNLIHQFERNYPFEYREIEASLLPEIIQMEINWFKQHPHPHELLEQEHRAVLRALENYMQLKIVGGALLVKKQVIAYSFAEYITNEMLLIHAEKAFLSYHGAYQMMNHELLKHLKRVPFVNREEDLGENGLIAAKHSYHPIKTLKKFKAAR